MAAGWLRGKRYSRVQVFSVALLTVGVVVAAWADAKGKVTFVPPSHPTPSFCAKREGGKEMLMPHRAKACRPLI